MWWMCCGLLSASLKKMFTIFFFRLFDIIYLHVTSEWLPVQTVPDKLKMRTILNEILQSDSWLSRWKSEITEALQVGVSGYSGRWI